MSDLLATQLDALEDTLAPIRMSMLEHRLGLLLAASLFVGVLLGIIAAPWAWPGACSA